MPRISIQSTVKLSLDCIIVSYFKAIPLHQQSQHNLALQKCQMLAQAIARPINKGQKGISFWSAVYESMWIKCHGIRPKLWIMMDCLDINKESRSFCESIRTHLNWIDAMPNHQRNDRILSKRFLQGAFGDNKIRQFLSWWQIRCMLGPPIYILSKDFLPFGGNLSLIESCAAG